ncbi:MAG: divalent-cation tolerance protein CutA [Burkholderiaceae bacterium]|jgi:periplasmic divalent cation tolerance protein|nr:divalent-cation tolerance protein CutA [Burkholderiaceae bacterium]
MAERYCIIGRTSASANREDTMPTNAAIDTPICVVLTTAPSESVADELAAAIIHRALGACVQIDAVRSHYRWQGAACAESEWRLTIKTRVDRYPALEEWLREAHPYDTPQIVMLPIADGLAAYCEWVRQGSAG